MKYWTYFKYVVRHKWYVGIECWHAKLFLHAITHDLSKFLPTEFIRYARFFYRKDRSKSYKISDESDLDFLTGWNLHQKRNKHHWNYWVSVNRLNEIIPLPMPERYIKQMICDWKGMARKFGGSWQEYYSKNKDTFILHEDTERYFSGVGDLSGKFPDLGQNSERN